jgi:membrane protein required for colicin V production
MNPLDWMFAAIVLYSIVRAATRGLLREAFALGGLGLGFLLACWNYRSLGVALSGLLSSPPLAQLAAFLLILMAVMVLATVLGALLRRTAAAVGLGFLDRLLGALFGLLRGCLLSAVLLFAMAVFLPTAPWMKTSSLAPYFLRADHAVSFVMPSELRMSLNEGLDRFKHKPPDWIKLGLSSQTGTSPH